jgi:hypothetical protein
MVAFAMTILVLLWLNHRDTERVMHNALVPSGRLVQLIEVDGQLVEAGMSYPLLRITRLGRSPTSDVVLKDAFASTNHATIQYTRGRWWLEDLSSRNGTRLNEEFATKPAIISNNDLIVIGEVTLRVSLDRQ